MKHINKFRLSSVIILPEDNGSLSCSSLFRIIAN